MNIPVKLKRKELWVCRADASATLSTGCSPNIKFIYTGNIYDDRGAPKI